MLFHSLQKTASSVLLNTDLCRWAIFFFSSPSQQRPAQCLKWVKVLLEYLVYPEVIAYWMEVSSCPELFTISWRTLDKTLTFTCQTWGGFALFFFPFCFNVRSVAVSVTWLPDYCIVHLDLSQYSLAAILLPTIAFPILPIAEISTHLEGGKSTD